MRILISNDDGFQSQGIGVLSEELRALGHDVWVVAPQRDRSTVGHSLTLHKPLRMIEFAKQSFFVSGSPADCVYMATRFLLKDKKPDLVVSGINHGANLGTDIFYSGTVAAAREGHMYGIPSVAMSLCRGIPETLEGDSKWEVSRQFLKNHFSQLLEKGVFKGDYLTNISIPDISPEKVSGIRAGQQGRRFYTDMVREDIDPRKKKYYWLGGAYEGYDNIPGSDCVLVNEGAISITPLRIDTTDYERLQEIQSVEDILWT